MQISVYIDNNAWDFLFERKIDLSTALPSEEFCLCLTREAEFEIPPIPTEKAELKKFIEETINKCTIQTRPYFGFYDSSFSSSEQRVGGFGEGYWISAEEQAFIEQQKTKLDSTKKRVTGLYKNEADISIAARSFHSVVITLDRKRGPINEAYRQGGNIIFLDEFDVSGLSIANFIKNKLCLT